MCNVLAVASSVFVGEACVYHRIMGGWGGGRGGECPTRNESIWKRFEAEGPQYVLRNTTVVTVEF